MMACSTATGCASWCSTIRELAALEPSSIRKFRRRANASSPQNKDAPALLFDIPLLFETGGEEAFDKVIVVSAPPEVQRERVLARPGMTPEKLASILARQTPDEEKRRRADFVIDTGGDLSTTEAQVGDILACLGLGGPRDNVRVREIVFDTETTGLNPAGGDRMVEIGCVEIFNRVETGRHLSRLFQSRSRDADRGGAVHGLTDIFLSDKPRFSEDRVEELLEFIEDAPLVAHNAGFDFGFLNFELERCGRSPCA